MTIIIPTYNRIQALKKTLKSIFSCSVVPNEIVVVEQSEDADEHVKILKYFAADCYKGILKIEKLEIPSSTHARNVGINLAQNGIIVFMDDDVEVEKNIFADVYEYMSQAEYSMIGGFDQLAVPNGNVFPFIFGMRCWKKREQGHVTMSMFGRYPTEVREETPTQWAMGYFFAVKKNLIEKWKLVFDETMGQYAYAEDLDFTYSYYKHSADEALKCILSPKVKVLHLCSKEWRASGKRVSYVMLFHRYYLLEKHFGNNRARILFWWSNVGVLVKKVVKRDNVKDFVMGMVECVKFRKDIKKGIMHTELYE